VLGTYAAGPRARALWRLTEAERRAVLLKMLTTRLGPKAAAPREVLERNWAEEPWTRGCSLAHFPTGVLTQYGRCLREPVGRVHWAGTETATTSHGAMDGAVRSGERVCGEIVEAAP
jgi:monoamine oxidase